MKGQFCFISWILSIVLNYYCIHKWNAPSLYKSLISPLFILWKWKYNCSVLWIWLASQLAATMLLKGRSNCLTLPPSCQLCSFFASAVACFGNVLPASSSTLQAPLGPVWPLAVTYASPLFVSLFATRERIWTTHSLSWGQWMWVKGREATGRLFGQDLITYLYTQQQIPLSPSPTRPT